MGTESSFNFCPKCGKTISGGAEARFCAACGHQFYQADNKRSDQPLPPTFLDEKADSPAGIDYDLYVQQNTAYYIERFLALKQSGKNKSWNWSAFLFAPFWMLYRKMYTYGFVLLALCLLVSLVFSLWACLLLFVVYILAGVYGNALYMRQIDKLVYEKATAMKYMNESMFYQKRGGVDAKATGFAAGGYVVLSLMISFVPFLVSGTPDVCAALTCDDEVTYRGTYCYEHKCDEFDCEKKTVPFSDYCFLHQIVMPFRPYCKAEGYCSEKAVAGGSYCFSHTCIKGGCVNIRNANSSYGLYCVEHK